MKSQLDRIEAKLDRLLNILGAGQTGGQFDDLKAIKATSGDKGLQQYLKNIPTKK